MDEDIFIRIAALRTEIALAEKARDEWQRTSTVHFEMAREMVASMQRRLDRLIAEAAEPEDPERLLGRQRKPQ